MRRSLDLTRDLTVLFLCAVSTVLLTRSFLAAAGYPQVGGSKFHIAHVLYGGLLLLVACIALIAFLDPRVKPVAAVVGGVGFGLFIDEVGKFITKDVNYFYRPAFAIIYVCFVALFMAIRFLGRRGFTAQEAVLIALDALQAAAAGRLTEERRTEVLALLRTTDASGPIAAGAAGLLEGSRAASGRPSLQDRVAAIWRALVRHPQFRALVVAILVLAAIVSGVELAWLLRHGTGSLTFAQKAFGLVTAAADVMLVLGALELRRSLVRALRWYEHAVVLEILVGQVFLYSSEQLAATLNLFALLATWALLHWAIRFESAAHTRNARGTHA